MPWHRRFSFAQLSDTVTTRFLAEAFSDFEAMPVGVVLACSAAGTRVAACSAAGGGGNGAAGPAQRDEVTEAHGLAGGDLLLTAVHAVTPTCRSGRSAC